MLGPVVYRGPDASGIAAKQHRWAQLLAYASGIVEWFYLHSGVLGSDATEVVRGFGDLGTPHGRFSHVEGCALRNVSTSVT